MSQAALDIQLLRGPVTWADPHPFPAAAGAECVFLGRTRAESSDHGALEALEYSAYEPMAREILLELATTAMRNHGCLLVRVHHALGRVAVGEASVLVQTACPHRSAAFDSCRWLIDALKRSAPIWKREIWSDGATWAPGEPAVTPAGLSGEGRS